MASATRSLFTYSADPPIPAPGELVATVPAGVDSIGALMDRLARQLAFPDYFGRNWNALYDCLLDFSWTENTRIVIWHEGVPDLDPKALARYLEVLADAVAAWRSDGSRDLVVAFPPMETGRIGTALAAAAE